MKAQAPLTSLTVEEVPIDRLCPDPANPGRISGARLDPPSPPVGARTDEFSGSSWRAYPAGRPLVNSQ